MVYERSENESRKKTTSFSSYSMYDVLSVQLVLASHVRALSVDGDHDEADERQNERNVHGWHVEELAAVDYRSLERRQLHPLQVPRSPLRSNILTQNTQNSQNLLLSILPQISRKYTDC